MAVVRAAGGVLWRPGPAEVEICLVHRPRRDDWTLPKGKLHAGEHPLVAAVREVAEETGVRGTPLLRLPAVSYVLDDGAPKTVDFWSMRAEGPAGPIDSEVDDLAWLPLTAAIDRTTYPSDTELLRHFAAGPAVTCALALVRHGDAGERGSYPGSDTARPLDERGRAQAEELAGVLAALCPGRLISAAPRRCVQTLDPLAELTGLRVEVDSAFDEPGPGDRREDRIADSARRLAEVAATGDSAVVCSQGKVIPPLLALLYGQGPPEDFTTPKGTGWLLSFGGTRLVAHDRLAAS